MKVYVGVIYLKNGLTLLLTYPYLYSVAQRLHLSVSAERATMSTPSRSVIWAEINIRRVIHFDTK